jgi:hypothetical protein
VGTVTGDPRGGIHGRSKPHGGPTADRDRGWHWSEQGAEQVDAMLEKRGWKQVAEAP